MEGGGGPTQVEVRLLGGFEVRVADAVVPGSAWNRRTSASLVKLLSLEPTLRLHRDRVVDALWPDLSLSDASPRLHKAAHYARTALGLPDAIAFQGEVIALWPSGRVTVDVHLFDEAASGAEAAQLSAASAAPEEAESMAEEARARAEHALSLYTGDLLVDDLYDPWTASQREARRLRRLRLLRQAGRWEELAEADPSDEEAHVRLAHMLARRGDRTAALLTLDRLERTLADELAVQPGPAVARLREAVLAAPVAEPDSELVAAPVADSNAVAPAEPAPGRGTPLPAPLSRMVGRGEEIARALDLLEGARILTVLGPGGVGKTTLAVEVARRRALATGADACFVDLTEVEEPAIVPGFVGSELGIRQSRDADPELALAEAVRGRRLVVLLDNFEHLLEAADLIPRLVTWSEGVEVIVTSRARLKVTGEQVLAVEPFHVPAGDDDRVRLRDNDAVVLFSQVAAAVDPGFDPERHLEEVARICRTVDGLPLAITLAAGHVRTLPPPLLSTRLATRLGSAEGARRDAPSRQRTIPATIDWSLQLLGRADVRLFTRLGVFAAPVSLHAIERICSHPDEDVVSALSRLVDQSLVQRSGDGEDARFRMLELVRERSRSLLAASPDREAVAERHATHVVAELERLEAGRWNELAPTWIASVTAILPEVRAAFAWARARDDLPLCARIVGTLGGFWLREGHHMEALEWVGYVLPGLERLEDAVAGRVLVAAALLYWTRDPTMAATYWKDAVERFRTVGDHRYLAYALGLSAGTHTFAGGTYDEALSMSREATALGRAVGDPPLLAQILNVQGELARNEGDDALAETCYLEGLELVREVGDRAHQSVLLANFGYIASHRGDFEEALRVVREALALSWSQGLRMVSAWTLSEVASPLLGMGRELPRAAVLVGAGEKALQTLGAVRQLGDQAEYDAVVRGLREAMGESAYEHHFAEGGRLTLAEAVSLALQEDPAHTPAPGESLASRPGRTDAGNAITGG